MHNKIFFKVLTNKVNTTQILDITSCLSLVDCIQEGMCYY